MENHGQDMGETPINAINHGNTWETSGNMRTKATNHGKARKTMGKLFYQWRFFHGKHSNKWRFCGAPWRDSRTPSSPMAKSAGQVI